MPVIIPPSSTTYFVYECDVCQGEIRVRYKWDLVEYLVCGKKLCPKCFRYGLCDADLARLSPEEQEKIKEIDARPYPAKKKMRILKILTLCFFLGGCPALFAMGVSPYLGFPLIGFWVAIPVWAFKYSNLSMILEEFKRAKTAEKVAIIQKYIAAPGA